jgi:hypothetical protein
MLMMYISTLQLNQYQRSAKTLALNNHVKTGAPYESENEELNYRAWQCEIYAKRPDKDTDSSALNIKNVLYVIKKIIKNILIRHE